MHGTSWPSLGALVALAEPDEQKTDHGEADCRGCLQRVGNVLARRLFEQLRERIEDLEACVQESDLDHERPRGEPPTERRPVAALRPTMGTT